MRIIGEDYRIFMLDLVRRIVLSHRIDPSQISTALHIAGGAFFAQQASTQRGPDRYRTARAVHQFPGPLRIVGSGQRPS